MFKNTRLRIRIRKGAVGMPCSIKNEMGYKIIHEVVGGYDYMSDTVIVVDSYNKHEPVKLKDLYYVD